MTTTAHHTSENDAPEFNGLTHSCDNPDCHVIGFVNTLRQMQGQAGPLASWTEETPLSLGQIRAAAFGLPDDAQVFVDGNPDRPVVGALQSEQIPFSNDAWEPGEPLVTGLELWLGGDEHFPTPRCQHRVIPPGLPEQSEPA